MNAKSINLLPAHAMMPELTDLQVAQLARQRVQFKMNLMAYVVVNLFLIVVWWVTTGSSDETDGSIFRGENYFWPIWPILGWGLGLSLHWYSTMGPGSGMQEREEQKIRQQMGKT